MPPLKTVTLKKQEQTAILTLDHPPVNAISLAMLDELEQALDNVREDSTVKAAVLRSRKPKFFAAGADIKEIAAIGSAREGREYAARGKAVLDKIETAGKPFLAAVEGVCLGGGCELALACHIRIVGAEAVFGLPEIKLGIMPGFGGTQRLIRLAGPAKALEMMLTGESLDAQQALAAGLANRIVERGAAYDAALELAKRIQDKSAPAIAAILAAVRAPDNAEGFNRETRLFGELCETEDKQEGLSAFLEKRPPRFRDR
ncbi:MAG: enoyl-CoA hydratase-related protein [Nitrospinales bacterium]